MNMTKQKKINPIFKTVLIVFVAALMLSGCECLYPEKAKDPYNRTISYQGDKLTADMLPGLWQCYYPMYVGNVEFKEIRMFSTHKADIIMEDVGGSDYYAETFKWRFDGNYLSFTKGNTTYQFQVTGFIFPEIYLRDSHGNYTWAKRRTEDCIK
jgi:hypothetical protein